jgi:acetyl-CoA carboxylase carboxyl transferase subunit beta
MAWFKRKEKELQLRLKTKWMFQKVFGISLLQEKIDADELERNLFVSPEDGFHVRIGSSTYFEILFDNNEFVELDKKLNSKDPLHFVDTKKYADRLKDVMEKTKLKDAVRTGVGKSREVVICCMDFAFIGGSMGAVGENLKRNQSFYQNKIPFIMISKSGGARMMEAAYSLMQLAKHL